MTNRVVIVTGSTSGIGIGIARAFAVAGDDVVVHGRSRERAEAVVAAIQAAAPRTVPRSHIADLEDPDACDGLVAFASEPTGRLDVLVNNAGTNVFTGVEATTLDDWRRAIDLDLRAAWLCSRAAARVMPAGSAIVNIASNHALSTLPGSFPYNVAKAGLVALTQSLAIELSPRGIRANVICPGYVDTPLADSYFDGFPDPAAERERVRGLHPVGRIGTVDDIARAALFLASADDAGFITGTSLLVDGGRSALMEDPRPS